MVKPHGMWQLSSVFCLLYPLLLNKRDIKEIDQNKKEKEKENRDSAACGKNIPNIKIMINQGGKTQKSNNKIENTFESSILSLNIIKA